MKFAQLLVLSPISRTAQFAHSADTVEPPASRVAVPSTCKPGNHSDQPALLGGGGACVARGVNEG